MRIQTTLMGVALAALVHAGVAPPVSAAPVPVPAVAQGVIRVQSAYGFDETVARIKADVAAKGIRFFDEIDQSQLAAGADINLRPSKLLLFGNPPLGVQFLTANPYAGLDWPVRMLVVQDPDGKVWVAWTDFGWMAKRYGITDRVAAFAMAATVSASIAGSTTSR